MFPLWHIAASEANGLSGGLAVMWDPSWINAKAYKCFVGIFISVGFRGHSIPINTLNIYAPYKNRSHFWEKFFDSEIFDIDSLMTAGDLNITLSTEGRWGKCKQRESLSDKIRNEFLHRNLIDVVPSKMMPTWSNGRIEEAYIAKRIDWFIVHANVIDKMGMPFSTIQNVFISNHRPISLCCKESGFRSGYPFKFNRSCLQDPAFELEISKAWKDLSANGLATFRDKMSSLKKVAKAWKIKKRQSNRTTLQGIQKKLNDISILLKANSLPSSLKCRINELEREK